MTIAHWRTEAKVDAEAVTIEFERGRPVAVGGKRHAALIDVVLAANRVAGRHGLGTSDQLENRVIDAKSRGIYEAPGMALLHVAYERLLSAIHNENTLDLYVTLGRKLGRLLYEGKWFDAEAMLIKDALTRWIAPSVSGSVTIELRRGDDYSILETNAEYMAYAPEKLSMERTDDPPFRRRIESARSRCKTCPWPTIERFCCITSTRTRSLGLAAHCSPSCSASVTGPG